MPAEVMYMNELILSLFCCAASLKAWDRRGGDLERNDFEVVAKDFKVGGVTRVLRIGPRNVLTFEAFLPTEEKWRQNAIAPLGVRVGADKHVTNINFLSYSQIEA